MFKKFKMYTFRIQVLEIRLIEQNLIQILGLTKDKHWMVGLPLKEIRCLVSRNRLLNQNNNNLKSKETI